MFVEISFDRVSNPGPLVLELGSDCSAYRANNNANFLEFLLTMEEYNELKHKRCNRRRRSFFVVFFQDFMT